MLFMKICASLMMLLLGRITEIDGELEILFFLILLLKFTVGISISVLKMRILNENRNVAQCLYCKYVCRRKDIKKKYSDHRY